jgi:2-oxoisovalerate dehydrogenase E1 component
MDLDPLETHLLERLRALPAGEGGDAGEAGAVWHAQVRSRLCDFAARALQSTGRSFYSIASAGHESNAVVALALRPTDPALLHYRSGAFYLARAGQAGRDGVPDILRGVTAAREEPIAGGRHKVFGNHELAVIPQTSTIASHLPRAVGVALAIERANELGLESTWRPDSVVVCSFGDASVNHAAAQAGLNTAAHFAHQGAPLPLLFVCEDNRIGISVRSPEGWVESALRARSALLYEVADGDDPEVALEIAEDLAERIRENRRPAVLHLRTVRFLSHAGADVETAYRTPQEIRADWDLDPLLATGRWLAETGALTGEELAADYLAERERVIAAAHAAAALPQLDSAEEVMRPLAPRTAPPAAAAGEEEPVTLAQAINLALADGLEQNPKVLVFGEDVALKGGVYGVTRGLQRQFGDRRVFDTLLDETSILGLALGTAVSGFLPVPEIQYLAYLHNAEDQLRGEAATLQFFSQGRYRNGMVVRIAGYGYQKGFGGHFHNDDAVGVLRDIPGIVIASPGRPDDAAALLRTCLEAARVDGTVCVYLEPIALYHTRDLHQEGDDAWLAPAAGEAPLGRARTYGEGGDLTIVSWANGLHMSLRVARRLEVHGVRARVVDLRWLAPLPLEDLLREGAATGRMLVVDETRRTGGVSEGIVASLLDAGFDGKLARVASKDSFIPLGDAANLVLLSEAEIEEAALALCKLQPSEYGRNEETQDR